MGDPRKFDEETFLHQFPNHEHYEDVEDHQHPNPEWWELPKATSFAKGGKVSFRNLPDTPHGAWAHGEGAYDAKADDPHQENPYPKKHPLHQHWLNGWYSAEQNEWDNIREKKAAGGAVQPTDAQKQAGNYLKDHLSFQGLPISIENRKGSERSGVDGRTGRRWSVKMPADYGYIKRTEGADGDHVDVYVGPDRFSPIAFIVNQNDHHTGRFDEHKVILGTRSEREARSLYVAGFSDGKGAARLGNMQPVSIDGLRHWLKHGKTAKPANTSAMVDHALKIASEVKR